MRCIVRQNEILENENLCVEEHAPFCMAECPVHFDARDMCILIENGDYKTAYQQYKKAVLFPETVSELCDAPCENKCKRSEAGGSIRIKELERFILERGKHVIEIPESNIVMTKKIAIVGDKLDSMAIILTLMGKGYCPDLFVSTQDLEAKNNDFGFIDDERIKKHKGKKTDNAFVSEVIANFDAVYFSEFTKEGFFSEFKNTPDSQNCFYSIETDSIIEKISHGKQMAVTIDRFVKSVSITAGRKNEGSYETQLYTTIKGIESKSPVQKSGADYSENEALNEAERCIKCRCVECVKQCSFMDKFGKYPRKYIREAYNNISTGGMGFRKATPMINSCTLCGLCEKICPNNIPMAEILRSSREVLVEKKAMPPRYHDFPLRDMLYSNSDAASFFRHAKGKTESSFMFFPGCQLIATSPEYVKPMYEYLSDVLDSNIGLMLGCCGAPAMWAGRPDIYGQVMDKFRQIWEEAGKPVIITACPTCNREFTEALPEANVETIWHYYSSLALPEKNSSEKIKTRTLSIHDPCTTRYRTDMHEEIRKILKNSGRQIEEYEYSGNLTRCCGYGGLIGFNDTELAGRFSDTRVDETVDSLVTYCSMCREFFTNDKKPVYHILDIIYGNDDEERGFSKKTGISEKMENRVELKNTLLKEIWDEDPADCGNEFENVSLVISDGLRKKIDERLILDDNIREVIYEAEKTGGKVVDPGTGHFTARKKIGYVTYWVVYEETGGLYIVHTAYSHRIRIMEDGDEDRL